MFEKQNQTVTGHCGALWRIQRIYYTCKSPRNSITEWRERGGSAGTDLAGIRLELELWKNLIDDVRQWIVLHYEENE